MTPTITKTIFVNSHLFDCGYSPQNLRVFSTETSFITAEIFSRWANEAFLKRVHNKRKPFTRGWATSTTRSSSSWTAAHPTRLSHSWRCLHNNGLRYDSLWRTPHTAARSRNFLRCKNIMRTSFQYRINLQDLDDAIVDDIDRENGNQPPSPERGRMIVEVILQILTTFHQAPPHKNVVSAFKQAGICSRSTRVDPTWSVSRLLSTELGSGSSSRSSGFFKTSKKSNQPAIDSKLQTWTMPCKGHCSTALY